MNFGLSRESQTNLLGLQRDCCTLLKWYLKSSLKSRWGRRELSVCLFPYFVFCFVCLSCMRHGFALPPKAGLKFIFWSKPIVFYNYSYSTTLAKDLRF